MPDDQKSAAEAAPPQKGDGLLKAIYWTVGVLGLLALLGALWVRHVDAEHQRILREARAAVEMLRVEPVADEDNAARVYEEAFNSFSMPPLDICRKYVNRLDNFELDIGSAEIGEVLNDNATVLDALARAAKKPRCVYVTDYSAGIRVKGPSLLNVHVARRLLTGAARRAAHDGRYSEAVAHIRQTLCLGRGVGQVRTVIYHMSWADCEEMGLAALRDVLTQTEPDGKALDTLHAALADHTAKRPSLRDNWHGDLMATMLHRAEIGAGVRPPEIATDDHWEVMKHNLRWSAGLVLRNVRVAKEVADDTACLFAVEPYGRDSVGRYSRERARLSRMIEDPESPHAFLLTGLLSVMRNDKSSIGRLRCARLAVACRLHRLRTGALPAELKELAGFFPDDWAEVSADPFTGKPLGYKLSNAGFVIWSVGGWPKETAEALEKDPYGEGPPIFAVDPRLWEEHRAKTIELRERIKNAPKPRIPPARAKPPPAPRAR